MFDKQKFGSYVTEVNKHRLCHEEEQIMQTQSINLSSLEFDHIFDIGEKEK